MTTHTWGMVERGAPTNSSYPVSARGIGKGYPVVVVGGVTYHAEVYELVADTGATGNFGQIEDNLLPS